MLKLTMNSSFHATKVIASWCIQRLGRFQFSSFSFFNILRGIVWLSSCSGGTTGMAIMAMAIAIAVLSVMSPLMALAIVLFVYGAAKIMT